MTGNTAGATPPAAPFHIIATGSHGLSQQSINKQPIQIANMCTIITRKPCMCIIAILAVTS